jgi:hypothetical protein
MAIEDFYTETFEIKEIIETKDSVGDKILTENLIATVKGLQEDLSGDLRFETPKNLDTKYSIFYFPTDTTIKTGYLIYNESAEKYKVAAVENPVPKTNHLEVYGEFIK